MESLVVRLDMDPDAAKMLGLVLGQFDRALDGKLAGTPPQHTKKVLEQQKEHVAALMRGIERAMGEPVVIDVPDPSGGSVG